MQLAFATSDPFMSGGVEHTYTGRAFESLLRKLQQIPSHPAIVPLNLYTGEKR